MVDSDRFACREEETLVKGIEYSFWLDKNCPLEQDKIFVLSKNTSNNFTKKLLCTVHLCPSYQQILLKRTRIKVMIINRIGFGVCMITTKTIIFELGWF
jgi:hypothetical protein